MKAPIISLAQAVKMLGLHTYGKDDDILVDTDVTDTTIMCPMCSPLHTSRRLTLNLNFEKNAFRCPRCGFAGGVYKLIAAYTEWPEDTVEAHVKKGDLGPVTEEVESEVKSSIDGVNAIAPVKQRNDVYNAFLSQLTLNDQHRDNLRKRGLSDDDIARIGFKSCPKFMDPEAIPKRLISAGYDLRGVPGFYVNSAGKWAIARAPDSGFFIPIRNGNDMIEGFQIRFDHPNDKIPKYGYFTSVKMMGGTRAETWCCWAGENLTQRKDPKKPFDIILIEGPLKAYIVNALTGANVIAVPGVSTLLRIPAVLQSMAKMGLRCTYIAYDMDQFTNADVAKQLTNLKELLKSLKLNYKSMIWNVQFKGLDDWLIGPDFVNMKKQVLTRI